MVSHDDSELALKKRKRWILGCLLFVIFSGGALWLRALALRLAVGVSVSAVDAISESLPEPRNEPEGSDRDILFPLWPLRGPGVRGVLPDVSIDKAVESPSGEVSASPQKGKKKSLPPSPTNSRASVERVLGWAESQLVPHGITRGADRSMPAGIELYGVAALGIGLLDGDRLLTVDGVSVLERGQVVGAVLGARSRRAESMTAGLARRTAQGIEEFTVVVEQPYPEHVPLEHPPKDQVSPQPSLAGDVLGQAENEAGPAAPNFRP